MSLRAGGSGRGFVTTLCELNHLMLGKRMSDSGGRVWSSCYADQSMFSRARERTTCLLISIVGWSAKSLTKSPMTSLCYWTIGVLDYLPKGALWYGTELSLVFAFVPIEHRIVLAQAI